MCGVGEGDRKGQVHEVFIESPSFYLREDKATLFLLQGRCSLRFLSAATGFSSDLKIIPSEHTAPYSQHGACRQVSPHRHPILSHIPESHIWEAASHRVQCDHCRDLASKGLVAILPHSRCSPMDGAQDGSLEVVHGDAFSSD